MKILCFSPIELPYTVGARYTGLERLAVQFAEEWAKLGHEVSLIAHKDTAVAPMVRLLPCEGYEAIKRPDHAEIHAFYNYQSEVYKHDVVWDIGHLHLLARHMPNKPILSVFSANPQYEAANRNEKAPYGLISWSRWGVGQIKKFYGRDSRYQETIMVDPEVYKPSNKPRGERFLTIGRMSEEKGNINAVMLCKELKFPLDVAGGRGSEVVSGTALTDYEKEVMSHCDGKQIVYHGEVSEEEKVILMQTCKALLYITNHIEITSHKIQECMLCGAPVIVPYHGGLPEIVTHGTHGFLCRTGQDFRVAISKIQELHFENTRVQVAHKYAPQIVARDYVKLFEQVAGGLRW